jgi:hypothetical protein
MIPDYSVRGTMFKSFNRTTVFSDKKNGKEKDTIFGNDIPQTAKAKQDPKSAACCVINAGGQLPAGGAQMNQFYSTIWSKNLRNVLISNSAFGEQCCND